MKYINFSSVERLDKSENGLSFFATVTQRHDTFAWTLEQGLS